jgi:hypothetical protein
VDEVQRLLKGMCLGGKVVSWSKQILRRLGVASGLGRLFGIDKEQSLSEEGAVAGPRSSENADRLAGTGEKGADGRWSEGGNSYMRRGGGC